MLKQYIEISAVVKQALASGKGVVALESTIISHGMPYPQNVKTALEVERKSYSPLASEINLDKIIKHKFKRPLLIY